MKPLRLSCARGRKALAPTWLSKQAAASHDTSALPVNLINK
jgi:hypothetical protein